MSAAGNEIGLLTNGGLHPLGGFAFMLRLEGVIDLPCRAVKGLRRENEFEYVQEGGVNDYVHMMRKPVSKPFTFQVERYVGVDYVDPLALGTEFVLPVILFVNWGHYGAFKPGRTYTFTGCVVTAKEYGELHAETSALLVETTTLAFREMVCMDIPGAVLDSSRNI